MPTNSLSRKIANPNPGLSQRDTFGAVRGTNATNMKASFRYTALTLLFLFGAHLLSASNGVEGDSTKSKYPITDPRNPACPCHLYQKQADEEYARLFKPQGGQQVTLVNDGNFTYGAQKIKQARVSKRFFAGRKSHSGKMKKRKCFKDRLSRCFHF